MKVKINATLNLEDKGISLKFFNNKKNYIDYTNLELNDLIAGNCFVNYSTRTICIGVFDYSSITLVHELYHCIEFINNLINENNDKDIYFSESNAYLIAYIFKTFSKYLRKPVKRKVIKK